MQAIEILFWTTLFIVFYSYIGYGILLYLMVLVKRSLPGNKTEADPEYEPQVTLFVAAYNEKDFVHEKIANSFELDYPASKIQHLWVTDGSDDGTPDLLKEYPGIKVLHLPERQGKIAAINRAMPYVTTPLTIFSDANTTLGRESISHIVNLFSDPKVGCVSGEKRIKTTVAEAAAAAGEGFYWKYESALKKWDAELNSVVGAAGELFAIRTELFAPVEPDTILDDFIISLRIAMKGYTIKYNPEAFALETASADVEQELKRKIRIAAGGLQSVIRLAPLLNIFRYRLLSFQYISHRVLRWTLAPLGLSLIFVFNAILLNQAFLYQILFFSQIVFYLAALTGWLLERRKIKFKLFFIPYYFFIMNYAVYRAFWRFINKTQSVVWERAQRQR